MRLPKTGLLFSLSLAMGLFAGLFCVDMATAPGAFAQGTLTPPAGQSRLTAPGGRRGRAVHRHRMHKMHAPGRRRHRG